MSGASLDIDLSSFRVEVCTSLDTLNAGPENVYMATGTNLKVWYDGYLQCSNLILSLLSTDLQQRALQIAEGGVMREGGNWYNPHILMRKHMPPLNTTYRRFVNSMANALCSDKPLSFSHEYVTQVEYEVLPDVEYNAAMASDREHRRNW
jgi:hypothetical protein